MLYRNPAIDELAKIPQWVIWQPEKRGAGKPTKVPYCVGGRIKASSSDPSTWDTFDACYRSAFVDGHVKDGGVGFVVTKETEIIGADCDNCIDLEGNIDGEVLRWINRFNSYAEISPSGRGIRIFCRGTMPIDGVNPIDSQWEVYSAKRFLTVTGQHIEASPLAISAAQEAVDALLAVLTAGKIKNDQGNGQDRDPVDLEALRKALTGETSGAWHTAMLSMVAHLVSKGAEDWFILDWALQYRWHGYGEAETRRDVQKMIAGARAKGWGSERQPTQNNIGLVMLDDCQLDTEVFWMIDDVLPRCNMMMIYARGGSGKTYLGTSLALGSGTSQWFDHQAEHGAVLICAFERPEDAEDRLAALRDLYGMYDVPVGLLKLGGLVLDKTMAELIITQAKELAEQTGLPVRIIEIDTVSAALGGAKEDDEGLGRLRLIGERIHAETSALVVWIHHEGKGDHMGPRGHLALADACTVWWHVEEREDGTRVVHVAKANRGPDHMPLFAFKLMPFDAGTDRRGKSIQLCEVQLTDLEPALASPVRKRFGQPDAKPDAKLGQRQKMMLLLLRKLFVKHPEGVDAGVLRGAFVLEANTERQQSGKPAFSPAHARTTFNQTLGSLRERGLVEGTDDALQPTE